MLCLGSYIVGSASQTDIIISIVILRLVYSREDLTYFKRMRDVPRKDKEEADEIAAVVSLPRKDKEKADEIASSFAKTNNICHSEGV